MAFTVFERIRTEGFYYVDKTGILEAMLKDGPGNIVFSRPRYFGKTIMMQMLASFFDIRKDSREMFDGLYITGNKTLCRKWMNKRPVIYVSFREVYGRTLKSTYNKFKGVISELYKQNDFLLESDFISDDEKLLIKRIINKSADSAEFNKALFSLSHMLFEQYGIPAVLLVDDYDIPLTVARNYKFYNGMAEVMGAVYSQTAQNNPSLEFAVLSGFSSIGTKLLDGNSFKFDTILNTGYSEYFGFTEDDLNLMSIYYDGITIVYLLKEWNSKFLFGDREVYCPKDAVEYMAHHVRYWTEHRKKFGKR